MQRPVTPPAAFRPEIEGLRGLAVLVVVLFHAGLAGVGGGFVGVDLFFVLSGFLITGLLLRERERAGRISLANFYARRIRRLAPAGAVVLGVTLAASWLLLDPLTRVDVALDGAATALSVGNLRFALDAGDYFAPVGAPSPFLQFWSLGVEEQFYLVWPLLLLVAVRARRPRLAAGILISAVLGASLAANLVVTEAAPAWAFYSLPTRAWQLAIGGLVAVAASPLARLSGPPLAVVGWLGLGAVAAAILGFDAGTVYPGSAALLPSLGAAAILIGADRDGGPRELLARWPLRFLGRISYSLYLWHWPVLILGPIAIGAAAIPAAAFVVDVRVALVGLALALATVTCLVVEEPFRFGLRRRDRRPDPQPTRARPALTLGLTALVAIAVVAGGLSVAATREVDALSGPRTASPQMALELTLTTTPPELLPPATPLPTATPPPPTEPPPATPMPRPPGDPAPRPARTRPPTPVAAPEPVVVPIATPTPAPVVAAPSPPAAAPTAAPLATGPSLLAGLQPPLALAATDHERLKADRCIAYEPATTAPNCIYGSPGATFTVALVGDSHGSHWFSALEAVAAANRWRVAPFVKVSCPFIDLPVTSRYFKREYTECSEFRESTLARLAVLQPDLTIVAQSKWIAPLDPAAGQVAVLGAALGRTIARVPGRVAILVDNPHAKADVPVCLAANPTDIARCSTPRRQAMSGVGSIERAAANYAGVPTIDLSAQICVSDPCPAVVGGVIVYRDYHHLTATFARTLAPALQAAIASVIGG